MNIEKIEAEIQKLSPSELARFRSWFENFDAEAWDIQFENDVKSGALEKHAEQAIKDFKSGNYKKI